VAAISTCEDSGDRLLENVTAKHFSRDHVAEPPTPYDHHEVQSRHDGAPPIATFVRSFHDRIRET